MLTCRSRDPRIHIRATRICSPNEPYTLLAEGLDSDDNTTVMQTAVAATVGSTLGNTYATPAPSSTMTNQHMLAM
jgi:hypothetical protein